MFILNNLCAPYTWQILTAASELSSLYLSFCNPLMIFRIIISKYPQYIVVWATHLLCGNLEVGLMQNPWIRSAGKVSGESTFPSIFIWCKMKAAIYRQSCSKQKLTGSPGFVTLREIENILGFLNKHSVVCDWLWSNCSMEENIMHSMSQQHFPPGTDDSKESSQTLCRTPFPRWEPGLHPPVPACASPWGGPVLVWLACGTIQGSFEVRRHNSMCSKSTWELMQKKKQKSVTEVHSASACSSGWELQNEVLDRTGNRRMLPTPNGWAHLRSFSRQDSFCKTIHFL